MEVLNPPALKSDSITFRDRPMPAVCRSDRRVVWNFIHHMIRSGFAPQCVCHDDRVETLTAEAMFEEVFAVDDSIVKFSKAGGAERWARIVLGNDGWDAISDWVCPRDESDGFNAAMEAFDGEVYA